MKHSIACGKLRKRIGFVRVKALKEIKTLDKVLDDKGEKEGKSEFPATHTPASSTLGNRPPLKNQALGAIVNTSSFI